MELYHQLLALNFSESERFDQAINAPSIVEGICYRTLCAIRDILADDSLDDKECFQKIEQIVCLFEEIGSDAGTRHDFG